MVSIPIRLCYFARFREAFDCAEELAQLPEQVCTVAELLDWLRTRGGVWAEELGGRQSFRVAINQELARLHDTIPAGAEVALFPPVTGG